MIDSPHALEMVVKERQESRLREAEAGRLIKQLNFNKPALHERLLLGIAEQFIAMGVSIKQRCSRLSLEGKTRSL